MRFAGIQISKRDMSEAPPAVKTNARSLKNKVIALEGHFTTQFRPTAPNRPIVYVRPA